MKIIIVGIGDWGLGIGDWAQSPIPNPQSPIPNPHAFLFFIIKALSKDKYKIIIKIIFRYIYYLENEKCATKLFPINLEQTPIYLKFLLSKVFLFFVIFLLLSSTIINKTATSGIFIKSL